LTERFDPGALAYIIANFDSFKFRPETDQAATLSMIRRYLASSSPDGSRVVTCHKAKHGHGRYFADHGLSLQGMAREIRNAISYTFYDDLDFHNAHPSLLLQRSQRCAVPCPLLEEYCRHREAVLGQLGPSGGKAAVLAVINGGSCEPDRRALTTCAPSGEAWLRSFADEMRFVREQLVQHDSELLKIAKGGSGTKGTRRSNDTNNVLGSAVNLLLCDLENDALMALREYVEHATTRRVGVLVFDGCMVEKSSSPDGSSSSGSSESSESLLSGASDFVFAQTGYRLSLRVKSMALDKLDVPLSAYCCIQGARPPPLFAEDDVGAGQAFLSELGDTVTSCRAQVWVRDRAIWTDDKPMVHKLLTSRCMGCNIFRVTERGDMTTMTRNMPHVRRVVEAATALIPEDPGFKQRMWESNIGVVCYRNGLYDFRRGGFFAYADRPDVLPRQCVDADFPNERPPPSVFAELTERVLLSTLGTKEKVETYLALIARATAGEYADKQWAIFFGTRNSGKGLLQLMNEDAFGPYVNTVNANAFLLQQNAPADAAKALSWALDCEYARQTYTNEVKCDSTSRSIKLDGNLLKSFQSGGDAMSARKNHVDERTFRVATKLIMNLNDIPTVTPRDAMSTVVLLKFPYKFVAAEDLSETSRLLYYRPRDETLKTSFVRRSEVVAAFTWMVIDAYLPSSVVVCDEVREDTAEYREDIGDSESVMTRFFKVTGVRNDFVLVKDVEAVATRAGMSLTVVKDHLKKMGGIRDNNCRAGSVRHGRGFLGVRLIESPSAAPPSSADTSSPLEDRFRATLESMTGDKLSWGKARPSWLLNPLTGAPMELDMYNEPLGIAVEYNGSQHYEYPNAFHATRDMFDAQVARDSAKRALCAAKGVRLIEVMSRSDLEVEIASLRAQFATFEIPLIALSPRGS